MRRRFEGQLALVTGAASGIGAAVARKFVGEGARVVIADLQADRAHVLAEELRPHARFQHLDVTSEESWEAARCSMLEAGQKLDVLVNAAGIGGFGSVEDITAADWRRVMDVNVLGVALGCKLGVDLMKAKGGAIVNISSAMALRGDALQISYCASKAALLNVTRAVAGHCGRQNYKIRCNAVLPGAVDTPLLRSMESAFGSSQALDAAMGALHMVNRMGAPGEIADAVLFLASREASFITAANVPVDGGMSEVWGGSRIAES